MKPIGQYKTLPEFTSDIDASPTSQFSLKIMGQKKPASKKSKAVFHSASMLVEVYRSIPDPDAPTTTMPIQAVFGEIFNRGCVLNQGKGTYSAVVPSQDGNNLFQGDFVNLDLSGGGSRFPQHRLAMILSHSCGIKNADFVTVVPIYLESELDQKAVEFFRKKQSSPHAPFVRN